MSAAFSDEAWTLTAGLRAQIDELDFLRELGDGTLDMDDFLFYLRQDSFYLTGYAKALAFVATHAPDPQSAAFWAGAAAEASTGETELHETLLPHGRAEEVRAPLQASPTSLGYTSYLVATAATESYAVAAAALLPCFWVYADVSARLAVHAHDVLAADPRHPFAQWVANYDGEDFQHAVAEARRWTDAAAEQVGADERQRMLDAFLIATRYELLFWRTAKLRERWPEH